MSYNSSRQTDRQTDGKRHNYNTVHRQPTLTWKMSKLKYNAETMLLYIARQTVSQWHMHCQLSAVAWWKTPCISLLLGLMPAPRFFCTVTSSAAALSWLYQQSDALRIRAALTDPPLTGLACCWPTSLSAWSWLNHCAALPVLSRLQYAAPSFSRRVSAPDAAADDFPSSPPPWSYLYLSFIIIVIIIRLASQGKSK